jgi:hypothetical protein
MEATLLAMKILASGQEVLNFTNRYICKDGSYGGLNGVQFPIRKNLYMLPPGTLQRERKLKMNSRQRRKLLK